MKIIDPKSLIIHVNECPPSAKKGDVVSIDTEFFNMQKSRLHRPHGDFAGIGCSYDGKEVWILTSDGIEDESTFPSFMWVLDEAVHVYHNSIFDIRQIRRFCSYPDRKKLWDTMVLEQIMYAGWYSSGEFSLADLARRYLDVYMDKSVREEFSENDSVSMTQEQIEYLAVDVVATWRVYQEQKKVADENDLNVWKNIDRCAIYSLLRMNGMMLDTEAWKKLAEFNRSESERIAQKYEGINLGSWQQVLKRLKADGYNLKSTNEKELNTIIDESEFARDVLEYRGRTKAAGTYGESWVDEFVEADGRIYSNFYVNGASTGRMSSSNPNVENVPQKDGPHFRKCFVAQPGYVLVDADFSAQEPRVWSYVSDDLEMQNLFVTKKDIYLYFAKEGFGWELQKSDPLRKTRMKPTVLGAIFGLTKFGLLQKDQIPLEEGDELLNAFWKVFKRSKEYKDEITKTRDYVQTVYGRKYWLNPYQFGHENNCLNCVSDDTEILTVEGWKTVDQLRIGESVLSVSPETNELEVDQILKINQGNYSGQVLEFNHNSISAITTPNHRWYVDSRRKGWALKESQDLSMCGEDKIWISSSGFVQNRTVWTDDEVELLGWVLTDGFYNHQIKNGKDYDRNRVSVTQTKVKNLQGISDLFTRLGKHYHYEDKKSRQHVWSISCESATKIRETFPEKTLTMEGLMQMSSKQHRILFDTMMTGDGSWDSYAGRYRKFTAGTKERADAFLSLCVLLGESARAAERDYTQYKTKKYDSMKNIPKQGKCWLVEVVLNKKAQPQYGSEWKEWSGWVWCPSTRNGTWIAKRNGKVFITGNSPVQGTAADITKISGYRFQMKVEKAGYSEYVFLINYIHDELLVECREDLKDWTMETLHRVMKETAEACHDNVPAEIEVAYGHSWADCH